MLRPAFQHTNALEGSPKSPPLASPPLSAKAVHLTISSPTKEASTKQQRGLLWSQSSRGLEGSLGSTALQAMPSETVRAPRMLAGWRRWPVTRWTKTFMVDPCVAVFTSGIEPRMLAFSLALGLVVGIFPLCGTNSALCVLASILFRASSHAPTMFFAVFAATPLELGLIVPYVRLGEALLYLDHMDIAPSAILGALQGKASGGLLLRLIGAVAAWLLSAPMLLWVSYHIFLPVCSRFSKKQGATTTSAAALSTHEGL